MSIMGLQRVRDIKNRAFNEGLSEGERRGRINGLNLAIQHINFNLTECSPNRTERNLLKSMADWAAKEMEALQLKDTEDYAKQAQKLTKRNEFSG